MKGQGLLLAIVTAVVLGAVVLGFLVLGTPGKARRETLDEKRVENLRDLANSITWQWKEHPKAALPATLEAATEGQRYKNALRDPVTREPYGYRVTGPARFQLCATFDTEVKPEDLDEWEREWAHPAGRHCFTIDLDKRIVPERGP